MRTENRIEPTVIKHWTKLDEKQQRKNKIKPLQNEPVFLPFFGCTSLVKSKLHKWSLKITYLPLWSFK